jgi:hypothetical protein
MSLDRSALLIMIRVLSPTKCHQHLIGLIQEVIHKDPKLNAEERYMLQSAYKGLINERRQAIQTISVEIAKPDRAGDTVLRSKLLPVKAKIFREMKNYVSEVSALVDTKLISNAADAPARIFYHKLKADVFRYLCEVPDSPERSDFVVKATESYNAAMMNAQEAIPKRDPLFLGLILNLLLTIIANFLLFTSGNFAIII